MKKRRINVNDMVTAVRTHLKTQEKA